MKLASLALPHYGDTLDVRAFTVKFYTLLLNSDQNQHNITRHQLLTDSRKEMYYQVVLPLQETILA